MTMAINRSNRQIFETTMKKIFRTLMFGLLLCAGVVFTSCSNDPDAPMDNIPYERVLTPLNFTAEVVASKGTDITFSWSSMENADGYVLQIFASEDDLVAPNYDEEVPYAEFEVAADNIPYTVEGLEVDKTFWARLRATSNTIGDSKWAELEESVSTSAVRDALDPFVVERTESSITIAWTDAADKMDLTSVRVEKVTPAEGDEDVLIALTDDQKSAAQAVIEGLEACVNYKFTLLFGKSGSRGVVTAWTRPSTAGFNTVNTVEAIYNAINGTIGDVKLLVEYSETAYDFSALIGEGGLSINCNPYIIGETTEDGKMPQFVQFGLSLGADVTSVRLEDIYVDGNGVIGHFINNEAAKLSSLEFVNSELTNSTKGIIYTSDKNAVDAVGIEKFLISGCYMHDINATGSVGGDFIDLRSGSYPDIEVVNSTFYACARTFLRTDKSDPAKVALNKVNVKNCTFNYVVATNTSSNNQGLLYVGTTTGVQEFNLSNCVLLNMYNDAEGTDAGKGWVRIARNSKDSYAPVCSANIYYNLGVDFFTPAAYQMGTTTACDETYCLAEGGMILTDDPCVNSEAGKLYLTNGIIAANRAGDPRWWDATEPVVVRATELEVVTEPRVWDFTEKTIFQTESVAGNTIIDNIKIYGPAEIKMNEGITFTEAGVMGESRPESGALHFKAEGYGAVVISTVDGGYNASIQVIAGEDRYTVQADGVDHKVLFGDLVGVNDIYVLAGSNVTVTKVEWTQDLTPDATAEALKTPVVAFDTTSVDEGTELAVTASWAAVENAATYSVTFRGVTTEQTETSLLLDAATVAAMPVGEYEISVVAKPVETSSKYLASEAGVATFKVKKVVVGGEVTLTWDFSSSAWTPLITEIAALGSAGSTDLDVTIDGLNVVAGGKNVRATVASDSKPAFFQPNGGGSTTQRVFKFEAPASGTLAVKVSGTGSEDLSRLVNVKVGDAEPMQAAGGYVDPTIITFDVEVSAPTTVYVYPSAGLRFYSLEYTYVAAATPEPLFWGAEDFDALWNNAFAGNTGNIDAAALATATQISGMTINADGWTYNDLEFILGGGKFKFGQNNNSEGVKATRVQFGGSGNKGKQALVFEAPAAGTLYVEVVSSGDASRTIGVQIDDNAVMELATPDKTQPAAILEFDCSDAVAGSKIYIFSTNSGNNLFSIKYEM